VFSLLLLLPSLEQTSGTIRRYESQVRAGLQMAQLSQACKVVPFRPGLNDLEQTARKAKHATALRDTWDAAQFRHGTAVCQVSPRTAGVRASQAMNNL